MHKTKAIVVGLGVVVAAANGVRAADSDFGWEGKVHGWYEAGGTILQDAKLESFAGEAVAGNSVEFDPGFRFGIALGTEITRNLRLEVESGFHYNEIQSIAGATASNGKLYQVPVMGNIVLQFPNRTGLVPVVGAGVGAVYSVLDADNITLGATTLLGSQDTWGFGYQGFAGLRYDFRPDMGLGIFYHYLASEGPAWEVASGQPSVKFDAVRTHTLSLTLNFKF
jgi:opacity protein-like surface antigen